MSTAIETAIEFQVEIPEEKIAELRRRITATRWPTKELVDDRSQGVQLATLKALADYWTSDYDFGRIEERLNALPQFTTEIDGVEIHFIHVRSKHEDALPLIMTHGWPGSVLELLDTVDLGGELRQCVQALLDAPEVVVARPVVREGLERRQLDALRAIIDELLARPARRGDAPAEVVDLVLRNVDAEVGGGLDGGAHGGLLQRSVVYAARSSLMKILGSCQLSATSPGPWLWPLARIYASIGSVGHPIGRTA
jgi:hypothetical protein